MEYAFWDSSAIVSLCIQHQTKPIVRGLISRYKIAVWWATPVEIHGAIERLRRAGEITASEHAGALVEAAFFRGGWREMTPYDAVRDEAEQMLDRFPLKAADALQLAAALSWCNGKPQGRAFISGDAQLLRVAENLGFQTITA
jgi:predicted nucleic acid-binding protein